MLEDQASLSQEPNLPRLTFPRWAVIGWGVVTLLIALLAYLLGLRGAAGPGDNSPEVGFTRDMLTHHAQAVEMATLVRDHSHDEVVRQVALDMMLTQQAQIGQMQGWLNAWGVPIASVDPAMAWMDMPVRSGRMPGMASPEDINGLRALSGEEADRLFLELMIVHHRSAVDMAAAILDRSQEPLVRNLAQSIQASQASEIELMESLLAAKDAEVPEDGEGEMMQHP